MKKLLEIIDTTNEKNILQTMTTPKPRGRKPVSDRKLMLRIFVHESVILANGGEESSKEKCVLFLGARAKIGKERT